MKLFVLNGWAASPAAWSRCAFRRDALFGYVDQLDGLPERALEATDAAVLVGWSMGGSSALRLACRYPDRVRGLVLVAATPRMMADGGGWKGMTPRRLEALRRGLELTRGEGLFGRPEGLPNPYATDTPENLARGLRYLLETDLRAELRSRTWGGLPVRIFQSVRDGIVHPANADYLASVFPGAVLTRVPGSEHALPVTVPGEISAAVSALL